MFKKYKIVCKILIASEVIGIYNYLFADRGKYGDSGGGPSTSTFGRSSKSTFCQKRGRHS